MYHVAIMRKSWGLTEKILSGEKKIESRWYLKRNAPWNKVAKGDTIYFKDSGEQVLLKAKADKVLQFSDLTPKKVKVLLIKYAKKDGIEEKRINYFYDMFKNKKYCVFIFLKNVKKVKPFDIDKKGFGAMAAWITTGDVGKIKLTR